MVESRYQYVHGAWSSLPSAPRLSTSTQFGEGCGWTRHCMNSALRGQSLRKKEAYVTTARGLKCRGPSADAGGERRENVRRRDDTPPDNKTAAIRPVVLSSIAPQRDSSLAVAAGRDCGV